MRALLAFSIGVVLLSSIGCGLELTKQDDDRRQAGGIAGMATGDEMAAPASTEADASQSADDSSEDPSTDDTAAEDSASGDSTDSGTIQQKAKVGVGRKGRYEGSGLVVTPLKAYFRSKERIAFDIQIPQALQLYQASNGYYPRTQEEFDSQILEANNIKLPALPAGHRYVYDPQRHELMVEQPAP